MATMNVTLTAANSETVRELSDRTGKQPEEVVNGLLQRLASDAEAEEHRKFLGWREALIGIQGMWADRNDLPDFEEVRRSLDRALWGEADRDAAG